MTPNPREKYLIQNTCIAKFGNLKNVIDSSVMMHLFKSFSLMALKPMVETIKYQTVCTNRLKRKYFKPYLAGFQTHPVNRFACRGKGDDGQIHHRRHSVLCFRY
jgi:hypothetical protein